MKQHILFAFSLPGDLSLPRAKLVQLGVPDDHLVQRTATQALRLTMSQDCKIGWTLTGASGTWRLHDGGGAQAAYVRVEEEQVSLEWLSAWLNHVHPDKTRDQILEQVTQPWENFITRRVAYHLSHVDRPNIHRAIDRWLEGAGAQPGIIPGLRTIPVTEAHVVRALVRVLQSLKADYAMWLIP
jgi:hypothetical protein